MGRWNHNIYIHSSDLDAIERGLIAVFKKEGYHHIPKSSPHIREYYSRHYDYMRRHKEPPLDSLRVAVIFPGGIGWTMMQTYPVEILFKRATGTERPRLADLTVELGGDAFQLNLYHNDTLVLRTYALTGKTNYGGMVFR